MTATPPGTAELLTAASPLVPPPMTQPPADGPLVPLSDPTWDQTVIDWLRPLAGSTPPDDPLFLQGIEYYRLQVLFPNRYVIFRDVGDGEGEDYRLLRREVYFHTTDFHAAQAFLNRIPFDELSQFCFEWNDSSNVATV